jgi:hypothetical protein
VRFSHGPTVGCDSVASRRVRGGLHPARGGSASRRLWMESLRLRP